MSAAKSVGLKMAKASEADLENAMALSLALELMTGNFSNSVPVGCHRPTGDNEFEELDLDNHEQCQRILRHLMRLERGLARVVYGCAVMLDPVNHFVDQSEDTIEYATPKAKPLVWVDCKAHPYTVSPYLRSGEKVWRALHWQFDESLEKWLMTFFPEAFASEADAKAWCEAHHQAAHREQSL